MIRVVNVAGAETSRKLEEARGVQDIERHRDEGFSDIEGSLDELRPWILLSDYDGHPDTPLPLTKDLWGNGLKMLKAKRDFLGLDAAARSLVTQQKVVVGGPDDETAMYLAELAAWARRTNAINTRGFMPALPTGMTERPEPDGDHTTNGHGIYGRGMWSMVLESPSEEEDRSSSAEIREGTGIEEQAIQNRALAR